ncbi:helix-turn-helix domain-containing protein [Flagellimonas sp. DF-77]|uniref:helix-turn-helix domain-containing protein n=1 Tax=Flagellimonas algarum TaxID=3230298 RepID=UPI0033999EFF
MTSNEIEGLKERLYAIFKNDKPYLDEQLTLKKTADLLQTSDKKLSELLNNNLETNFYDFINTYRVNEVKERLHSKDALRYTLIAIAYDCGFTSKTSFYRAFKKSTGYSPSTYRKKLSGN